MMPVAVAKWHSKVPRQKARIVQRPPGAAAQEAFQSVRKVMGKQHHSCRAFLWEQQVRVVGMQQLV
jgi:hypothetical protein